MHHQLLEQHGATLFMPATDLALALMVPDLAGLDVVTENLRLRAYGTLDLYAQAVRRVFVNALLCHDAESRVAESARVLLNWFEAAVLRLAPAATYTDDTLACTARLLVVEICALFMLVVAGCRS
jgi:hypothetical protein